MPYANSIPPQRDSLYALSTAIDKKKPIQRWIDSGKLSSESTVRDVFSLTSSKKRTKVSVQKERNVFVTIEFSTDFSQTATLLKDIVQDSSVLSVRSDKAFKSALQEILGRQKYSDIDNKVS